MKLNKIYRIIVFPIIFFSLITMMGKSLHWNKGRGYDSFRYATQNGIIIDNQTDTLQYDYYSLPNATKQFNLSFRAKNINGHPSRKYPYYNKKGQQRNVGNPHWGFFIYCLRDTIAVTIKGGEKFTALEPMPSMEISVHNLTKRMNKTVSLTEKINPYDGDNLWTLNFANRLLTINTGNHDLNPVISFPCNTDVTGFGFFAGWGDKLQISDIKVEFISLEAEEQENYPLETLEYNITNSNDPMEGYWTLFDRELEESLLKLGGSYNVLCVKDGENYIMIYIDGATINSKGWKSGDVKAILKPTHFPGIYDVVWTDAMKANFDKDVKAQLTNGNVLVIQFPYQNSRIRLRKIDK